MAPPPTSWASQTGSLTASTMEQTDAAHSHPLAARSARAIGSLTPQVALSPREGFGPAGTVMAGSTDDARPAQALPDPKQMPMTAPQATSEGSPPITVKSRHGGAFEHHVYAPKIGETLPLSQNHAPPALNTQDPERTDQPILRPAFSSTDDPRPTQTTSRGAPSDPVVPFPVSARLITQSGLTDAAASKASTPAEGQLRGAISPNLAHASAAATNIAQGLDPIQLPRQLAAQMVGEHTLPQAQVAPNSTHPVPPQMLLPIGAPVGTAPMSPTSRDVGRITPAPSIEGGGGSLGLPIASSNAVVIGNVTGAAPAAPPPSTAQQIAAVATQVPHDGGAVELTLDPPELGRVRMSLNEIGGVMTLAIQADRSETADLMRRYIDHLHQEFQRAGLEPPQVRIFQDGAAFGRNPNGQPRDDNPHPGSAASQRFADDTPDPHLNPPHHPPGSSGLDLRI